MSSTEDFSLGEVEVALSPVERFREFLESRGKKFTTQRELLVQTVFQRHDHFEADELVESVAYGNQTRVGRATVYRTLNELTKAGLLRKLELGDRVVYEHDYGYPQHDHLHCERCQKLIEFHSDELVRLRDEVASQYGFQVSGHRLIITGVCHECRQARRRRKRPVDLI
jgi:Fur family ferric uptake transcriptional regulator